MTEESFEGFVREALEALASEVPEAYARVREAIGTREVEFQVDVERFFVRSEGAVSSLVHRSSTSPSILLKTSPAAVASIAGGECSILTAILDGRVQVFGPLDGLLDFDTALHAYLCGAVRAPGSPALRARFQSFARQNSP